MLWRELLPTAGVVFLITGLYEYENIAFNAPGLNWYMGGGAHIGFWNKYNSKANWWNYNNHPDSYTVFGVDFIIGLEYAFGQVPLNIAIDYKPGFNFIGYTGFLGRFCSYFPQIYDLLI